MSPYRRNEMGEPKMATPNPLAQDCSGGRSRLRGCAWAWTPGSGRMLRRRHPVQRFTMRVSAGTNSHLACADHHCRRTYCDDTGDCHRRDARHHKSARSALRDRERDKQQGHDHDHPGLQRTHAYTLVGCRRDAHPSTRAKMRSENSPSNAEEEGGNSDLTAGVH